MMALSTPYARLTAAVIKYSAIARTTYRTHTTYITGILSKALFTITLSWIFTQLYSTTYAAAGATEIGGLTVPMLIWILTLVQTGRQATPPYVSQTIEEEVRSGEFAYAVNRPYSYLLFHVAKAWGRKFASLIPTLAIGSIAALLLVGPVRTSSIGIVAGFILLLFGHTLGVAMHLVIGLCAFWLEDIAPLRWMMSKSQMILGGNVVPLALFPPALKTASEFLPWSQFYYYPALMVIQFSPALFLRSLGVQIAWLAIISVIATLIFRRGIKNVATNGG